MHLCACVCKCARLPNISVTGSEANSRVKRTTSRVNDRTNEDESKLADLAELNELADTIDQNIRQQHERKKLDFVRILF